MSATSSRRWPDSRRKLSSKFSLPRRARGIPGPLPALTLILFCVGLPSLGFTEPAETRRSFALAAGVAEVTLEAFSEQADVSIVFPLDDVRGVATNPVQGKFAVREALERLIAGTALEVRQDGNIDAFVIRRARARPAQPTAARAPDSNSTPSTPLSSMNKKKPFVLIAAWLGLIVLRAADEPPSATIEGRVHNPVSGDYINNVRVGVEGTPRVAFTDSTGFYRIASVPPGEVTLRVSYTGQPDQQIAVQVTAGQTTQQDISLGRTAHEIVKLDQFTVVATREMDAEMLAINEQRHAGNIKNVIAADAFGDVTEGNVGEFIKRLPGVTIEEGAADAYSITLRGFSPEFTPISVDGNTIPSASFSVSSVSRGSNLEQVSMSNVARIEVIKSPIPSAPADSLGGSVNLISKSAFERTRPQLSARATLQFTSDDYKLKKTPGPGNPPTRKMRPGYEFSYINPVSENFGFTISSMLSDQYGRLMGPLNFWEFASAQGGSETEPYLRRWRSTDDQREARRQSFAGSVDWRPIRPLTLSLSARHNIYDLLHAPQRFDFNTGNNPVSFGPNHTQGRAGAATIAHQQQWIKKFGDTDHFTFSGRYREGSWRGDFSASYARSGNKYRDIDDGFFRTAATRSAVAPTLRWEGFSGTDLPRSVDVRNAAGAPIDYNRLDNYLLVNVQSAQRDATDEITQGSVNLRRELTFGSHHGAIQIGGSNRKRKIDRSAESVTRNFVGADGIPLTADDNAGPFADMTYVGVKQAFGQPERVEFPDLRALLRLYRERPQYFALTPAQATAAYVFEATNSEAISEEISAAYVQGDVSLLQGRLKLLGGVRFERTENRGVGLLRDRNAVYQRDAAGNILRAPNGNPIFITNDTLARAQLEYIPRGLVASRSYSDYYPSINATYSITRDLLLRVSYARTLGRPNFNHVVPNLDIIEDLQGGGSTGLIVARNPSLQPWEADNYEVSLEYYFTSGGVVSASAFRKNVTNGFGTQTIVLDSGLLQQFELEPTYLGWDLRTTFNIGELVRINGIELNYKQKLSFLPAWARGLSAFANTTLLDLDGPNSAFSTLYDRTANWGLSYSRGRVGLGLNWNYLSSRTTPLTLGGAAGSRQLASGLTVDMTSEFRVTPRISVFLNARNLSNKLREEYRFLPQSPEYSRAYTLIDSGVRMSAGVRGSF